MRLEEEILINKYAQGLADMKEVESLLLSTDPLDRRDLLTSLSDLILQSKASDIDVKLAINAGGLKETFTPCVLLLKGVTRSNLDKIVSLPEQEQIKILNLFMQLFKIAYLRRYDLEKGNPHKWWYWDLSDDKLLELLRSRKR